MKARALFGMLALTLAMGFAGNAASKEDRKFESDETRGYMGVALMTIQDVDEGEHDNGVYVQDVMEGTPAEAAGLKADDRLLSIDGVAVNDFESLNEAMRHTRPEQTVSITLERAGVEQTFSVTLDARPSGHDSRWGVVLDENRPYFGVHIEELNPQLAKYFEVDGGLLVTEVIADAPADKAGLLAGDIVVAVEDQPVRDSADLHRALTEIEPGDDVAVRVERRGAPLTLFVKAGRVDESALSIHLGRLHELVENGGDGHVEVVVPEALHEHPDDD
jgi:serine protease Do